MINYITYLAWAILTLGIFVSFIAVCIHGVKLVRRKLGVPAAFLFVLGLLAFSGQAGNRNDAGLTAGMSRNGSYSRKKEMPPAYINDIQVVLQNNFISTYYLSIVYGRNDTGTYQSLSAYSGTNGMLCGTRWTPRSIAVNDSGDTHSFTYQVTGTVEWNLLFITVYTQPKIYKGFAKIP